MPSRKLDLSKHKIWRDKNIKPEAKEIYAILHSNALDKYIAHINIGDIQNKIHITNVGFKNNLKILLFIKIIKSRRKMKKIGYEKKILTKLLLIVKLLIKFKLL